MTSGTKTGDYTSLVETYDQYWPSGTKVNISNRPVGSYFTKTWSGSDYPVTETPTIFEGYFQKVERAIEEAAPGSPQKKITYLERYLNRRGKPKRKYTVDHPYSMSLLTWHDKPHKYTWYANPGWVPQSTSQKTFRMNFGDGFSPKYETTWQSNDTIALQGKLREKIVGSDFDASVFLGESREALTLITDTAVRIRKALSAVRKGEIHRAAEALGVRPRPKMERFNPLLRRDAHRAYRPGENQGYDDLLAQKWLELQYGWLPLVKDAHGGAEALAQQLNEPLVQTYRVRRRKWMTPTPPTSIILEGKDWEYIGVTQAQLIARIKEVDSVALNGLADPASVLWELTPWSFVADWFIPVGNYLAARGLSRAVTGTFVTTITTKQFSRCSQFKNPGGLQVWLPGDQPDFASFSVTMNRTVSTTLSVPRPQFKPLEQVLSWKRATNAVALLVTNFGGGGKGWGVRGNS